MDAPEERAAALPADSIEKEPAPAEPAVRPTTLRILQRSDTVVEQQQASEQSVAIVQPEFSLLDAYAFLADTGYANVVPFNALAVYVQETGYKLPECELPPHNAGVEFYQTPRFVGKKVFELGHSLSDKECPNVLDMCCGHGQLGALFSLSGSKVAYVDKYNMPAPAIRKLDSTTFIACDMSDYVPADDLDLVVMNPPFKETEKIVSFLEKLPAQCRTMMLYPSKSSGSMEKRLREQGMCMLPLEHVVLPVPRSRDDHQHEVAGIDCDIFVVYKTTQSGVGTGSPFSFAHDYERAIAFVDGPDEGLYCVNGIFVYYGDNKALGTVSESCCHCMAMPRSKDQRGRKYRAVRPPTPFPRQYLQSAPVPAEHSDEPKQEPVDEVDGPGTSVVQRKRNERHRGRRNAMTPADAVPAAGDGGKDKPSAPQPQPPSSKPQPGSYPRRGQHRVGTQVPRATPPVRGRVNRRDPKRTDPFDGRI